MAGKITGPLNLSLPDRWEDTTSEIMGRGGASISGFASRVDDGFRAGAGVSMERRISRNLDAALRGRIGTFSKEGQRNKLEYSVMGKLKIKF